jgi:hypothetical protein
MTNYQSPTAETCEALDRAFQFFNERLFSGRLPETMITLQRKRGARGYFWAGQFVARDDSVRIDEIALNPEHCGRTVPEVLSTLVHEMVHLRQQHEGSPGKNGNHNKEWGTMMDEIGLEPTATGVSGGKRTGRKVTHAIVPDGPFALACEELVASGLALPWFARPPAPAVKKKDLSKVKHTCPSCGLNAWAKTGVRIECSDCDEALVAEV